MERIKKNFGFGFMRLPLLENGEVNLAETTKMVDAFLEAVREGNRWSQVEGVETRRLDPIRENGFEVL